AGAGDLGIIGLTTGTTYTVSVPDATKPSVIKLLDKNGAAVPVSLATGTTTNIAYALSYAPKDGRVHALGEYGDFTVTKLMGASQTLTPAIKAGVTVKATLTSAESGKAKDGIGGDPTT